LALRQAHIVKEKLREHHPALTVAIKIIKTQGDRDANTSLAQMGGEGVFVKEIEEALLAKEVDVGVHSMKDVPTLIPETLEIGAVLERTEYRDAFISNTYEGLSGMPSGSIVGTSSFRRQLQVFRHHPHLVMKDIRGNVDTRLKKMDQGDYDAIIMSAVGLDRLQLSHRIKERLTMLPAIGQGALCLENRKQFEWPPAPNETQTLRSGIRWQF